MREQAGIRKQAKVAGKKDGPEQLSVHRALKAVARADVAVLVLDALQGPTEQDFRLADRIAFDGRACVGSLIIAPSVAALPVFHTEPFGWLRLT